MILVDPKRVELNHYESIPHLLTPVVTNMKNAALVLQNIVREMDSRYELMGAAKARNLSEWNAARAVRGQDPIPYVLVVIDELADLMMVSPAEVEDTIIRLAQKSRAVGIHLVLATQSPRVDVITGMIKANVPSRIAFAVSSQTDSRVILDMNGAEALLGEGDMLYKPLGTSKLQRVQGAFISESETAQIVMACRRQAEPSFEEELLETSPESADSGSLDADDDPVLEDAIRLVAQHQTASVSLLQRRLRVGYTRAGRLIDMLERRGIVSGYEGSKARKVLITERDLHRILGRGVGRRPPSSPTTSPPDRPAPRPAGSMSPVTEDWYQRLASAGVLDVLAPYQPALVGAYPLGIAAEATPVEIVCRATDLPAFARVVERAFGIGGGVRAPRRQPRRRGGGVRRADARRPSARDRRPARARPPPPRSGDARHRPRPRRVAPEPRGPGWPRRSPPATTGSGAAVDQFDLSRTALESLANANPALVARVMGIRRPGPDVREYVIAVALGVAAEVLIVAAGAARGSQEYTGLMLMLQAVVLGVLFGARLGLVAALAPLVAMGPLSRRASPSGASRARPTAASRASATSSSACSWPPPRARPACCATGTSRAPRDPGDRHRSARSSRPGADRTPALPAPTPARPVRIALLEPSAPLASRRARRRAVRRRGGDGGRRLRGPGRHRRCRAGAGPPRSARRTPTCCSSAPPPPDPVPGNLLAVEISRGQPAYLTGALAALAGAQHGGRRRGRRRARGRGSGRGRGRRGGARGQRRRLRSGDVGRRDLRGAAGVPLRSARPARSSRPS